MPKPLRRRFNSRAHGGRDKYEADVASARKVSIHAPTGGATVETVSPVSASTFQFTRPRGARPPTARRRLAAQRFNSRAHGGRDDVAIMII